jgi:hypothetical protein
VCEARMLASDPGPGSGKWCSCQRGLTADDGLARLSLAVQISSANFQRLSAPLDTKHRQTEHPTRLQLSSNDAVIFPRRPLSAILFTFLIFFLHAYRTGADRNELAFGHVGLVIITASSDESHCLTGLILCSTCALLTVR